MKNNECFFFWRINQTHCEKERATDKIPQIDARLQSKFTRTQTHNRFIRLIQFNLVFILRLQPERRNEKKKRAEWFYNRRFIYHSINSLLATCVSTGCRCCWRLVYWIRTWLFFMNSIWFVCGINSKATLRLQTLVIKFLIEKKTNCFLYVLFLAFGVLQMHYFFPNCIEEKKHISTTGSTAAQHRLCKLKMIRCANHCVVESNKNNV